MTTIQNLLDRLLADLRESGNTAEENELLTRLIHEFPEGAILEDVMRMAVGRVTPGPGRTAEDGRDMGRLRKMSEGYGPASPDRPPPILSCRSLREERRLTEFEEEIMLMNARGISSRKIQESLKAVHRINIPAERISCITKELRREIDRWRSRPLEKVYPIVYLDGFHLKGTRDHDEAGFFSYSAVGISPEGVKDVLGIWTAVGNPENLGLRILSDLKMRGVEDIIFAFVDRVPGFRKALASLLPRTLVHISVASLVRESQGCVSRDRLKELSWDLKSIFHASNLPDAESRLRALEMRWYASNPDLVLLWNESWEMVAALLFFPPDIRGAFYLLNVIETHNSSLRKVLRKKRLFPSDEALFTVLFLTSHSVAKKWPILLKDWHQAREWLITRFRERMPTG
jgi:putative transposase